MRAATLALVAQLAAPAWAEEPFDPEAEFDAFWSLFDERYALFEVKRVDWDAVYAVYGPRVTPETTRAELFALFEEVADLLNDVHVTVEDTRTGRFARSGARGLGAGPFDAGTLSLDLIATRYADGGLTEWASGAVRYGTMKNGTVGYLHLGMFRYPYTTTAALDVAIAAFKGTDAVIVDVRQNGGGSDEVARTVAGRFADERRLYMTVAQRSPGADALDDPVPWYVEPTGPAQYGGPVVLLTNDRTISAAETFVLAMRTLPQVLVIGETTAGVMADTYPIPAGDGWLFGVPVNAMRDAQGMSWEGIGLPPDIWVSNTPAEVAAGTDRALEAALDFAGRTAPAPRQRIVPP